MSRMSSLRIARAVVLSLALAGASHAQVPDDALQRALADELARSMAQLRLADQQAPYYLAYEVTDHRSLSLKAVGGVLANVADSHTRTLNVDLRIGTPAADSSRVLDNAFGGRYSELDGSGGSALPIGDDYDALRRKIWVATDGAYKRAVSDYATRQAVVGGRAQGELPPDQVPVEPLQRADDLGELRIDLPAVQAVLQAVSAAADAEPAVEQSLVSLVASETTTRLLASDGTATWTRRPQAHLVLVASTRAADGEPLVDHWQHRVLQPSQLPSRETLVADATALVARLAAMRDVEPLRDYIGPVLFSGDAAAQLVALTLAPKLGPLPRFYAGQAPMQTFVDQMMEPTQGFANRIGARVLPPGGELIDDPTLREWNGLGLASAAAFDSEGVATRRKVLVQAGRLRELLSTRAPALIQHVTPGNLRGSLPAPSTLILRSDAAVDAAGLQREIDLLVQGAPQPWIVEVERFGDESVERLLQDNNFTVIFGNEQGTLPRVARASKRFPDGRREPLRGLKLDAIGEREFRHLAAIGDTPTLRVDSDAGMSMLSFLGRRNTGGLPQAYLVPPLLFEELAASEDSKEVRRVPILAKPSTVVAGD